MSPRDELCHEHSRLSRAIEATRRVVAEISLSLSVSAAENCLDDTSDLLSAVLAKLETARDLTDAEIARLDDAEIAA